MGSRNRRYDRGIRYASRPLGRGHEGAAMGIGYDGFNDVFAWSDFVYHASDLTAHHGAMFGISLIDRL